MGDTWVHQLAIAAVIAFPPGCSRAQMPFVGDAGIAGSENPVGSSTGESDPPEVDSSSGRGESSSSGFGGETFGTTGSAVVPGCDALDVLVVVESPAGNLDETDPEHAHYWAYRQHHERMLAGLQQLVSELYVRAGLSDVRLMVTGSIAPDPVALCAANPLYGDGECASFVEHARPDACDTVRGAGRDGFEVFGAPCGTNRWLDFTEPGFADALQCAVLGETEALWGYPGPSHDAIMDSLMAAVDTESAGCNAGFLRHDALLAVVLFATGTDPLGDTSRGAVETWAQALVDARGSDAEVVVLGLGPDSNMVGGLCAEPADPVVGGHIFNLVDLFPHGLWSSACLPDYGPFFAAGAEAIQTACEEFVP